jgi:hypothetical protein
MSQMLAFILLVGILYIGDVIATRTKAWIPSVFVCAVLFLIGYWTIFPKDIVARAGFPVPVVMVCMYLLVTNMGTLLSIQELIRQWKTIVISLAGIGGICASIYVVGMILFDWNTVIVGIPPLVGGIVSSLIMSQGAKEAGLTDLAVFAIILYVMQGFAGYPITAIMLKREGTRVLKTFRAGEWKVRSRIRPTLSRTCPACSRRSPNSIIPIISAICAWALRPLRPMPFRYCSSRPFSRFRSVPLCCA